MRDLSVSAHAIIRWLERVDGIDVERFRPAGVTDGEFVLAMSDDLVDDIRRRILCPVVLDAWEAGAHRIALGRVVVAIKGRVVCSILPRKSLSRSKIDKVSHRSRREEARTWE